MGWVSCIEDNIKRLDERIHRERDTRKALEDAKAILFEVKQYLELATSPEVDLAYEVKTRDRQIDFLRGDLNAKDSEVSNIKDKSAKHYENLQKAEREIKELRRKNRELEEKFNRIERKDLYDAYTSPSMLRKHKQNA